MKYLKLHESFLYTEFNKGVTPSKSTTPNTKKDEIISSIWGITESELFTELSDIEDNFEVEITCDFYLQSPKKSLFQYIGDNEDRMEGYAAAKFLPIIGIEITTNDDIRGVQSTLMECIQYIDGYYLYEISKTKRSLKVKLACDYGEDLKSVYHKKANIYFENYFTDFKKHGYKVIINKIFDLNGKYFIKHHDKSKKLYSIDLEKNYKVDINIIPELSDLKTSFEKCLNDVQEDDNFYDVTYDFEIQQSNGKEVKIVFSITAYEK